jgi:hypothetical protein
VSSAAVLPHASFSQAMDEFDRAWRHPQHTAVELEPLDVNAMLPQYYWFRYGRGGGEMFTLTPGLVSRVRSLLIGWSGEHENRASDRGSSPRSRP